MDKQKLVQALILLTRNKDKKTASFDDPNELMQIKSIEPINERDSINKNSISLSKIKYKIKFESENETINNSVFIIKSDVFFSENVFKFIKIKKIYLPKNHKNVEGKLEVLIEEFEIVDEAEILFRNFEKLEIKSKRRLINFYCIPSFIIQKFI